MSEKREKKDEKADGHRQADGAVPRLIVGLGSSAGGLEVLKAILGEAPAGTGIAYVVIAHLARGHSMLPELLAQCTGLPVHQAEENMEIFADRIYIIPPDTELFIYQRRLQLHRQRRHGDFHTVDTFFRSLALDQGRQCAAVILSGTGADGSVGIREIKAQEGLVLVQQPDTAEFDGMIEAALATGQVDKVLAPQEIIACLREYCDALEDRPLAGHGDRRVETHLHRICNEVRRRTGHDFNLYKRSTILRRIERRMFVHRLDTLGEYVRCVTHSESEAHLLFRELLIGVTNFFRDRDLFETLKEAHLPALIKAKAPGSTLRAWVAGCSTGEEAYSLAMVITEVIEDCGADVGLQLFGTDLDQEAIERARDGIYPESIAIDVEPERLQRFFVRENDSYRICKRIRELVVFAKQDAAQDPPFTRLDLLSCRNLLIYMQPELQKRLCSLFHYSLKENGLLVLGNSEHLAEPERFETLDRNNRIFRRRHHPNGVHRSLAPAVAPRGGSRSHGEEEPRPPAAKMERHGELLAAILEQSGLPGCVVVDQRGEMIYVHGRTGRYLEPAGGAASTNIIRMARPGLQAPLAAAIQEVARERREIRQENIRVEDNGGHTPVNLILRPLAKTEGLGGLMLVLFEEAGGNEAEGEAEPGAVREGSEAPGGPAGGPQKTGERRRLEDELRYTRQHLRHTIRDLESANEDLQSANEELQSSNEELQATNEELVTAKEELQSANEEAAAVNTETQSRLRDLTAAKDDIKNFLDATQIATMFLDARLRLRRYTPAITRFFPFTPADAGRPITHFASTLVDVDIAALSGQVLDTIEPHDSLVQDSAEEQYRLRIRPFRTVDNVIDGVVIILENVTEFEQMMASLRAGEESWKRLVEHAPIGLLVVADGVIRYANPEAARIFAADTDAELIGGKMSKRVQDEALKRLHAQLDSRVSTWATAVVGEEAYLDLDGGAIRCLVSATPLDYHGETATVLYIRKLEETGSGTGRRHGR